jgi:hypothetical protein
MKIKFYLQLLYSIYSWLSAVKKDNIVQDFVNASHRGYFAINSANLGIKKASSIDEAEFLTVPEWLVASNHELCHVHNFLSLSLWEYSQPLRKG